MVFLNVLTNLLFLSLHGLKDKLLILLLFATLIGCKKDPSPWKINNLEGGQIRVFGHGGMGELYNYPMNSMKSLNDVLDLGAFGTEMDVELSADNVLVLYHNNKLEDGTRCDGVIRSKNWSDIKNCHYTHPITKPALLISADDFLSQRRDGNFHFTFDCKVEANDNEVYIQDFTKQLYDLILKYNLVERCTIESYNMSFLKVLQEKDSLLRLFVHADTYHDALGINAQVKLYGITMDRLRISAAEIDDAHARGLRVALYNTYTEKANLDAIEMNPDIIQSDKCDFLLNALN